MKLIKLYTPFIDLGASQLRIAFTFSGFIYILTLTLIINLRYFIDQTLNSHLLIFNYSPTSYSRHSTFYIYSLYLASIPLEYTKILLIYTKQNSLRQSLNIQLIYFQKVLGVLASPNSVTSYLQSLYLIQKAIFYLSPSIIRILQKAIIILSFVNYFALLII